MERGATISLSEAGMELNEQRYVELKAGIFFFFEELTPNITQGLGRRLVSVQPRC